MHYYIVWNVNDDNYLLDLLSFETVQKDDGLREITKEQYDAIQDLQNSGEYDGDWNNYEEAVLRLLGVKSV